MQLAPAVNQDLQSFVGGEITLANNNSAQTLVRGTVIGFRELDEWIEVTMTCDHYATGTLETLEEAAWNPLDAGSKSPALLMSPWEINEQGELELFTRTPQGSIALIKRS